MYILNKFKINHNKHNSAYVCQVVFLLKVYNKADYFNEQLPCKHRCVESQPNWPIRFELEFVLDIETDRYRRGCSDNCEQLWELFNFKHSVRRIFVSHRDLALKKWVTSLNMGKWLYLASKDNNKKNKSIFFL